MRKRRGVIDDDRKIKDVEAKHDDDDDDKYGDERREWCNATETESREMGCHF
ncbi:hypothetical protein Fmac_022518 [Flemingia macrophylla]|uniref:Uncharacterized protein n=1 Tax=Flemingia macrophylla TaxID=520843 RepID=A0ABD1M029_9FABA